MDDRPIRPAISNDGTNINFEQYIDKKLKDKVAKTNSNSSNKSSNRNSLNLNNTNYYSNKNNQSNHLSNNLSNNDNDTSTISNQSHNSNPSNSSQPYTNFYDTISDPLQFKNAISNENQSSNELPSISHTFDLDQRLDELDLYGYTLNTQNKKSDYDLTPPKFNDQIFDDHDMWDNTNKVYTPTIRITEKHLKPLYTPVIDCTNKDFSTTVRPFYENNKTNDNSNYKTNLNLTSYDSKDAPIAPIIQNLFYKSEKSKTATNNKSEVIQDSDLQNKVKQLSIEIESYQTLNQTLNTKLENLANEKKRLESRNKDFELEVQKWKEQTSIERSELAQERVKLIKLKDSLDSKSRQLEINNLPTRKDKEELESCKTLILTLQTELKDLSGKSKASIDRMKQTINVLTTERSEFQSKLTEVTEQNKREMEFKVGAWNREKVSLNKQIKELKVYNEKNDKTHSNEGPSLESEEIVDLKSVNKRINANSSNIKPFNEPISAPIINEPVVSNVDDASNIILESLNLYRFSLNLGNPVDFKNGGDYELRFYLNGIYSHYFPNKTEKIIFPNGDIIVKFSNGDLKKTKTDKTLIYFYLSSNTYHITKFDCEIFYFGESQREIHFKNGEKEILFADNTRKFVNANGEEKAVFPNGIIQTIKGSITTLEYPNGKKEVVNSSKIANNFTKNYRATEYEN